MTLGNTSGGLPYVLRETITTTGRKVRLSNNSAWVCIRISGNPAKLFFSQDDFDNDENYIGIELPSDSSPYGEFRGVIDTSYIWIKGYPGSTDVELVSTDNLSLYDEVSYPTNKGGGGFIEVDTVKYVSTKSGTVTVTFRGNASAILHCDTSTGISQDVTLLGTGTDVPFSFVNDGTPAILYITGDLGDISRITNVGTQIGNLSDIVSNLSGSRLNVLRNDYASIDGDLSDLNHLAAMFDLNLNYCCLTGDLDSLKNLTSPYLYSIYLNGNKFKFASGGSCRAWSSVGIRLNSCLIPSNDIDTFLSALVTAGVTNCTIDLGGNFPRTTASDSDYNTLVATNTSVIVEAPVTPPADPGLTTDSIYIEGDSISVSTGWPSYLNNSVCDNGTVTYGATSGHRTNGMLIQYPQEAYAYKTPIGYIGYFILMAGTNDLHGDDRSAAYIIDNLKDLYINAKSDYTYVTAFHILPNNNFSVEKELRRTTINSNINLFQEAGLVDFVVPVPSELQDPSDTYWYPDGMHPSVAGQKILASSLESVMGWV